MAFGNKAKAYRTHAKQVVSSGAFSGAHTAKGFRY